jgi:trehalose synthase
MDLTKTTPPESLHGLPTLDDYAEVIGAGEVQELQRLAGAQKGRGVTMINTTPTGGGVAEILNRMVPLMQELGLAVRWEVMKGGEDFFAITKAFHNALHGVAFEARPEWFDLFLQVTEQNRATLDLSDDFVVIHDPQPVALIQARNGLKNRWIWRCHIDLSRPNLPLWNFLRPYVERYDATLFSAPAFTQGLPNPQYLFYPAIDPLADKNRPLEPEEVRKVVEGFGIDPKRPILTQVSRFDRLKDPVGVIQAYRKVRKYDDCQLVLAGGSATDDPEGEQVLAEVREAAGNDPDIHILNLPPWSHLEINALQRGSTIVLQKSLREGFGLTVSEALLKKRPVVASAVGGIPSQVIHKMTGLLVHSIDGAAYQIRFLLSNPAFARQLGENGYEHVKENFLLTHNIKRYLLLFLLLSEGA